MEERRAYSRYNVAYCAEQDKEKNRKLVQLEDISNGGASFVTEEELYKGQKLDFRVFLRNKMFEMEVIVAHVEALNDGLCVIGARFIDPSEEFVMMLETEIQEIEDRQQETGCDRETFREASIEYQQRKTFELLSELGSNT
ncbi:MAG: PilZ domain-containing protein [Candidatus Omnitrophota bacterium]